MWCQISRVSGLPVSWVASSNPPAARTPALLRDTALTLSLRELELQAGVGSVPWSGLLLSCVLGGRAARLWCDREEAVAAE